MIPICVISSHFSGFDIPNHMLMVIIKKFVLDPFGNDCHWYYNIKLIKKTIMNRYLL